MERKQELMYNTQMEKKKKSEGQLVVVASTPTSPQSQVELVVVQAVAPSSHQFKVELVVLLVAAPTSPQSQVEMVVAPMPLRHSDSTSSFKAALKTHLFNNYF